MVTVTATFARIPVAAAGYTLSEGGVVSVGDRVVHRVRVDDGNRMTDADDFALVDCITSVHPDRPALVLAYADRLHMDELGALGLAFRTAPTLRDSLIRAERYFRRVTDTVRYRLDESGTLAVFARNLIRLGGDTLSFEDVCFSHGCETDPDHYASGLGCPVRFSAEEDGIVVRPDMLDLTKRLGDPAVAALMTTHLDDQIEAMAIEASFADTLLHRLSTGLST